MKEMSWRKVLADRSCGDPRAYRLIQARSDKTSLRSADYVKSLCSTSEFGISKGLVMCVGRWLVDIKMADSSVCSTWSFRPGIASTSPDNSFLWLSFLLLIIEKPPASQPRSRQSGSETSCSRSVWGSHAGCRASGERGRRAPDGAQKPGPGRGPADGRHVRRPW